MYGVRVRRGEKGEEGGRVGVRDKNIGGNTCKMEDAGM
jgi:hypothetical protein